MDLRTGAAFWPLKNGLLNSYPALAGDERADVLVIGAGITGALVAERLSAASEARRQPPGCCSTRPTRR